MNSKVDRDTALELFNDLEAAIREHYNTCAQSDSAFQQLLRKSDKLKCFLMDDFESLWYMEREDRKTEQRKPPQTVSTVSSVYEPCYLAPAGQGQSALNTCIVSSETTTPVQFRGPPVSPVLSAFELEQNLQSPF